MKKILAVALASVSALSVASFAACGMADANEAHSTGDYQVIKNMNIALSIEDAYDTPQSIADVFSCLEEAGFNVTKMTPTADGYDIYWDSVSNRVLLWSDAGYVAYPDDYSGVTAVKDTWYLMDGTQVMATDWAAAFSEENFYNVTVNASETFSGETQTIYAKYDLETDSDGNITGATYLESDGGSKAYYYEVLYNTGYSMYFCYSSVYSDDAWAYNNGSCASNYLFDNIDEAELSNLLELSPYYSNFKYENGCYVGTIDGYTYTVTFDGAELAKFEVSDGKGNTLTYEFSYYGSTHVTVPRDVSALYDDDGYIYLKTVESSALQMVKNLNTALILETAGVAPQSVEEVIEICENNGYSVGHLALSDGLVLYWDSQANVILLWSENNNTVMYPASDYEDVSSVPDTWYSLTD